MILLVYLPPVLYLAYKNGSRLFSILIFSILFGLIGGGFIDLILTVNSVWHVETLFKFRVFGHIPIEDLIWGFLMVFYIVLYYEYFYDRNKFNIENKYKSLGGLGLFLFVTGALLTFLLELPFMQIPYVFILSGLLIIFLVPGIVLYYNPRYLVRFVKVGIFFFFQSLFFEVISLSLGHWVFKGGQYIGWVNMFGVSFPFEEFMFWPVLFSTATLAYYELFFDTKKR